MVVEKGTGGGLAENEDVRRRALLRLGVAGVVTAAALAGLWWLDQGGGKKAEAPAPAAQPSPIVSAPMRESAPPRAADAPEAEDEAPVPATEAEASPPGPAGREAAVPVPPPGRALEAPPPPRVSNTPRVASLPAAPPRQLPAAAMEPAARGERFVVRVGVFSDPREARELVEKLQRQGIRAHLETRVHLGPFASREAAEQAREALRKQGFNGVLNPAVTINPALTR